jgi:type I restriction enzyme, S subunit
VSKSWPEVTLADLVEIKHGFAFKGEYFTDEPTGVVLLTPGNFAIGGGFQFNKLKFYKDGPIPPDYVLQPGDLLVTMTDLSKAGDTLGYSAVVPTSEYLMLHNQRLGKVTAKGQGVDLGFVHWLLRDDRYRAEVLGSATGSTVRHTSPGRIGSYRFRLPPLPEQRAIGATLGALDDKIELNRKMNATLEAMARALFRDWFVDFGPTRAKAEGRAPYLSPDLWPLFPARLDANGKPDGWEVSTIGDEVRVVGGSTPSTKEPALWDGGINWATPKDLSTLAAPVLLETSRSITAAGLAKISSGLLPVGSLLLSSRAPIGYLAIAEVPVAINQGFIGMICDKRVSNVFAWLWTRENKEAILAKANGSTFQEISKGNFRPLPVVVPSDPVLRTFDAIAKPLYERIAKNERESRTLAQTRDLLLPRLMSGELRVAEAERAVEAAL